MFSISQYVSYFNLIHKIQTFNTKNDEGCLLKIIWTKFLSKIFECIYGQR